MCAVSIRNRKDPRHSRSLAVNLCLVVKGEPTAVPALGKIHREGIFACQQIRDVIGLTIQVAGVVSKAAGEQGIAHLPPVDLRLVQTQSGDGKGGFFHFLGSDLLPEYLHRTFPVFPGHGDKMIL